MPESLENSERHLGDSLVEQVLDRFRLGLVGKLAPEQLDRLLAVLRAEKSPTKEVVREALFSPGGEP